MKFVLRNKLLIRWLKKKTMANNFKIIYKILSSLEKAMEYEEFDEARISPQALGISRPLWEKLIMMLSDSGYITGVVIKQYVDEGYPTVTDCSKIRITLKGLEYLEENSLMQRAKNLAKGIIDIAK